ncbi:MAG: molybdopterin-dependent oxidoreductase [Armatimonadetes bacterium]|nr:molybdopterin-dependent oxidoreductase [Armatimonadota bacterium]
MAELSRRKFIQLTVMGGAVAATGCDLKNDSRFAPGLYRSEVKGTYGGYDNRVYPYLNQPDGLQDGVPQYFATACQMCPAGCGLFVRTMGGRAVNVQGNPDHPVSGGRICSRGVSSLQHLYNPDRLRFPRTRASRAAEMTESNWVIALLQTTRGLQGALGKVAVLADANAIGRSPTLMRMVNDFATSVGGTLTTYSLLDDAPWRAAAQAVYGKNQLPAYRLDEADVIVSFGGDFLEAWPSPVMYGRQFGEFRQGARRPKDKDGYVQGDHGRFIYVGPRMSMTAAKADVWLPCNPGGESAVASGVLAALHGGSVTPAAQASGLTEQQITDLANTIKVAGTRAVAVAGNGLLGSANSTAAFTAVEALNAAIKSQCVGFGAAAIAPPAPNAGGAGYKGVQALAQRMQAGQVGALVILGQPNPVFTLPLADNFAQALGRVPFVAALTPFEDETTAYADVLLPTRTFLEEWGDDIPAVLPAGARMATLRQPIIDPQFIGGHGQATDSLAPFVPWMDTRPLGDLLIDLARHVGKPLTDTDTRAAVRKTWAGIGQADLAATTTDNDPKWVAALAQGGVWTAAAPAPNAGGAGAAPPAPNAGGAGGTNTFALHLYPHIYWTDGRHANLGWHQEIADPMTSSVWNSWVEINMDVAHRMDIRTGDIVRVATAHGHVDVPAVPYPGLHPSAVAMPVGQGHTAYGRNANGRGGNPLAILDPVADAQTGALAYGATRVTLTKIAGALSGYNGPQTLVLTQDRPGGPEPEAVKDLIHTTAKEWKQAPPVSGAPQAEGSIFNRGGQQNNNPEVKGGSE